MKNFGREIGHVPVLCQIDLELGFGELACLLGPNGAGKSTLLSTLSAPQILHSGQLFFDGKEIANRAARKHFLGQCAYLGHEPGLFYDLSVAENIDFFAKILRPYSSAKNCKSKKQKNLLLEMTGLEEHQKKQVRLLSRGMQQKLGLLRCFLRIGSGQRHLYLLDEALNSLDRDGRQIFRQLLIEAKAEGAIILVSSHQESFFYEESERAASSNKGASPLATRFLFLREGRLLADIPIERYSKRAKLKLSEMLSGRL